MTLRPSEVTAADAAAARAAGASDAELEQALYVCYLFNVYDRCADAMGWKTRDEAGYRRIGGFLIKRGYQPGMPKEEPATLRRDLERAVLDGPGVTPAALRRAAAAGGDVAGDLAAVVAKTRAHAFKITDEEIAALRRTHADDALFEIIVAAAVGAAAERTDAGFAALAAVVAAA